MSGCTVFVFLSLMEYALVNIVMGDIADIEKKKSMGISNLILGTRGIQLPKRDREFPCDADGNVSIIYTYTYPILFLDCLGCIAHDVAESLEYQADLGTNQLEGLLIR